MYYSTHLIAGATVGSLTGDPVSGFVAGLLSHAVLDMIPHHDHEKVRFCLADVIIGTLALAGLYWTVDLPATVLWGAVGGAIPDVEVALAYYGLLPKKIFPCHEGWLPHLRAGKPLGLVTQLLVVALGLWVML